MKKDDYKDLIYEEIILYHDNKHVQEYLKNKEEYPEGVLFKRYGQERIKKKFKK